MKKAISKSISKFEEKYLQTSSLIGFLTALADVAIINNDLEIQEVEL